MRSRHGGPALRFPELPPAPTPDALDEVGAAAERAAELATEGRELHFERDVVTGRVVVQLRDLRTGAVMATMSPAMALDVMTAGERQPYLKAPRSRPRR